MTQPVDTVRRPTIPPKGAHTVYMRYVGGSYSLHGEVVSAGPKRFRMKRHGAVQEFLTEFVTGWLRDIDGTGAADVR